MALARSILAVAAGVLLWAAQAAAQGAGTVTGRVVDATTQQPLAGASVAVEGTGRGSVTAGNGSFTITGVSAGSRRVVANMIGYGQAEQQVNVAAGGTATVQFALQPQAVMLEELVATGYGTQRREAITGAVATVDAEEATRGVIESATEMLQGRVAGVNVVMNNGEPGAGAQIRIRGGTSISASNEPLYVVDGVPINNVSTEPGGRGIGGGAPLARNPLNLLNPNDIESISILKDASATAIYGSRGANGVVLITTKRGARDAASIEYDGYVGVANATDRLDLLSGAEFRQFVQQQVQAGNLGSNQLANLGQEDTNWYEAITREAVTQNHNLSFSGGSDVTRYRASLNYMDQEGVVRGSGFERVQGRLNGNHSAFDERLRLGLNLTASRVDNDYLPYENTGGFEGALFTSAVVFNPTRPIMVTDAATGLSQFYEVGTGRQSVRNPVAMAEQIVDLGATTRILGNVTSELDLLPGLTASLNLGVDQSEGIRRIYWPKVSPVGAEFGGLAQQVQRDNSTVTLQSLLTLRQDFGEQHDFEMVGGYEYNQFELGEFGAEARQFLTDAFLYNNLGGGGEIQRPFSWREESRLVSFFSRANYSFANRYFLTGVLRYDGSSRFGAGNKWALFPAVSAAWRLSEEGFMQNQALFSDLRLRVGYGVQGNQAVAPYASLILLAPSTRYAFGEREVTGVVPTRNPNPNLKWEETTQWNVGLDFGLWDNAVSGSLEGYVKNTSDLLLEVTVPQPALVSNRFENIGSVRNRGVELTVDWLALERDNFNWQLGLVGTMERNEVVDLGGRTFIATGGVSGQGQSGQNAQRIMPGYALGTFYGPRFLRVNEAGKQLFACTAGSPGCVNGETATPSGNDFEVIGDANPDFSAGLRSQLDWGNLDLSFLVRGEFGRDLFNNTALVYSTKGNALQAKNFLRSALTDPTGIKEPAIYSSRWIEDGSFVRLQNLTLGYRIPNLSRVQNARVYLSGDNLLLLTDYSGIDPEVHVASGLASRGIDYLVYPRARTLTAGVSFGF